MSAGYTFEHDWFGMIRILAPDCTIVATMPKHAVGTPGSGIPVDTHVKLQTKRAEVMVKALNEMDQDS